MPDRTGSRREPHTALSTTPHPTAAWAAVRLDEPGRWMIADRFDQILIARTIGDVMPVLTATEAAVANGESAAFAYLAYESAPGFDNALRTASPPDSPALVWVGIADRWRTGTLGGQGTGPKAAAPTDWQPEVDRPSYHAAYRSIRARLWAGDTYQVNYTYRLRSAAVSDPFTVFRSLYGLQPCATAAFIWTGTEAICSASPELFFALDVDRLVARPMKGTRPRGESPAADARLHSDLARSAKDRAENLMIVDMTRNDVGRVAEVGSISVRDLFQTEAYPTVWQMTSTIEARTTAPVAELFRALFPAASVTGAPKSTAMRAIAELESSPRGVYTGAVGTIGPGRRARLAVAIRTCTCWPGDRMEYGVGGGVIWESRADQELQETRQKAAVLSDPWPRDLALVETLLWTPAAGFFLLDRHRIRMASSALRLGFDIDPNRIKEELAAEHGRLRSLLPRRRRVRATLQRDGSMRFDRAPLGPAPQPVRLFASPERSRPEQTLIYHKTSHHPVFSLYSRSPGASEPVASNLRDEVTETPTANVVARTGGRLVTPPVECGLLPGVFRGWLLAQRIIVERVLSFADLERADDLFLVNSVRGWRRAVLSTRERNQGG